MFAVLRSRVVRLAAAGALALWLGGCEELCREGAITWCSDEESLLQLNSPPRVEGQIAVESRVQNPRVGAMSTGVALVDLATHLSVRATDPNADPMLVEWDLDGDGEFEQSRIHPSRRSISEIVEFYVRRGGSSFPGAQGGPGSLAMKTAALMIRPCWEPGL